MDFAFQRLIHSVRNPTAGVLYHWRALRYKNNWAPFCRMVEQWLNDWLPEGSNISTLVLIGPSAGYTLPPEFISRFSNLVAVDPDISGQILFRARFRRPVHWISRDFFGLDQKKPNPQALSDLFASYPSAGFLFCNVIGQLPILLRERSVRPHDIEIYMKQLGEILSQAQQHNNIASYHDRYSRDLNRPNEAVDHLTGELFGNWPFKKEFPWKLTNRYEHQIEFVASRVKS